MIDQGWIKLHRAVMDCGFWQDSQAVHLWIHLLMKASHKPGKTLWNGRIHYLEPGQLITGRVKLSAETGISQQTVRRLLNLFEINQQINQQKTSGGSCISILNWSKYQDINQQTNQRSTNDQPAINQPSTTIQECKNEKNEKNERKNNKSLSLDFCFGFRDLLEKFIAYRREIGKPIKSQQSLEAFDKKLHELSGGFYDIAQEIIEQSIANGWQGIFPLKNSQNKKSNATASLESVTQLLNRSQSIKIDIDSYGSFPPAEAMR